MAEKKEKPFMWWVRDLLELLILIAIILLIIVIYIPRTIWQEEDAVRELSRFRMENAYNVLKFYEQLTGERTDDGLWALSVVNAARDSLIADSLFMGKQRIVLSDKEVEVNVVRTFETEYDTVFGFLKSRKDTLVDTVLTIVMYNEEQNSEDTSFVRLKLAEPYLQDSTFIGIVDTAVSRYVEVVSYYDSYRPDSSFFFCPLTNKPYKIEATEEHLKIESPIEGTYKEPRYWVFSFKSQSHGSIVDGEKSWARF